MTKQALTVYLLQQASTLLQEVPNLVAPDAAIFEWFEEASGNPSGPNIARLHAAVVTALDIVASAPSSLPVEWRERYAVAEVVLKCVSVMVELASSLEVSARAGASPEDGGREP